MALTQIDFDEKEENKIKRYSKKWNLNKPKTIIKIINKFNPIGEKMKQSNSTNQKVNNQLIKPFGF